MTTVQIAIGHDNEGGLADVVIQPRCSIPEPGRRQQGGDQLTVIDGGLLQTWSYGFLTVAQQAAQWTEFGVSSAESAEVTVQTLNRAGGYSIYNAVITRPATSDYYQKFTGIVYDLLLLEELT